MKNHRQLSNVVTKQISKTFFSPFASKEPFSFAFCLPIFLHPMLIFSPRLTLIISMSGSLGHTFSRVLSLDRERCQRASLVCFSFQKQGHKSTPCCPCGFGMILSCVSFLRLRPWRWSRCSCWAPPCTVQIPNTAAGWRWRRRCGGGSGCWTVPPRRRWWCPRCSPRRRQPGCRSFGAPGGSSCGCARQPASCHAAVSNSTTAASIRRAFVLGFFLNQGSLLYSSQNYNWKTNERWLREQKFKMKTVIKGFSKKGNQPIQLLQVEQIPCWSQRRCPLFLSVRYSDSTHRYPRIPQPPAPSSESRRRRSGRWGPAASGRNVRRERRRAGGS